MTLGRILARESEATEDLQAVVRNQHGIRGRGPARKQRSAPEPLRAGEKGRCSAMSAEARGTCARTREAFLHSEEMNDLTPELSTFTCVAPGGSDGSHGDTCENCRHVHARDGEEFESGLTLEQKFCRGSVKTKRSQCGTVHAQRFRCGCHLDTSSSSVDMPQHRPFRGTGAQHEILRNTHGHDAMQHAAECPAGSRFRQRECFKCQRGDASTLEHRLMPAILRMRERFCGETLDHRDQCGSATFLRKSSQRSRLENAT